MCRKTLSLGTLALMSVLVSFFLLVQPGQARASCGCSKPPPEPAAVIPSIAVPGLPIALFHDSFQEGQWWKVVFESQGVRKTVRKVARGRVVEKRDITDPTGKIYAPQLTVLVPRLPAGPTRIIASRRRQTALVVSEETFTVIGHPIVLSEQAASYEVKKYTTGVGYDGTLYISLGGITNVCKAMDLEGVLKGYPLRFGDNDIVIWNFQGFLIDSVDIESVDHAWIEPQAEKDSDRLHYFRHSFETHCEDHLPGGIKEVDPQDPNWHLDGTPHVDYTTLIFAVSGSFEDGSMPEPGRAVFGLEIDTKIVEDEGGL